MKSELRKKLRKIRDDLPRKEICSKKIAEALLSDDIFINADTILLYYSSGSEVSTIRLFEECVKERKTVAFPRCIDKNGTMDFFIVNDENDLEQGMYGIIAPKAHCEKLIPEKNALCIVPGISFDKTGYRLGYGKGYYDRYLSRFELISVGLCYDKLLSDTLPSDIYDKKVDYLITDKKTYKINSKEDFENG